MRIPHITIITDKQAESIEFYKKYAGLDVVRSIPGIAFMGNGVSGETQVELIAGTEGVYSGSGISIGFECEDAAAYREELLAAGLNPSPMISPNPSVQFFNVFDPSGVKIQFISHSKK